jgi:putative tricarboxylic transport membrane protein
MEKADRFIGILVVLIGLAAFFLSLNLPPASRKGIPGPALLPQLIALSMIICGTLLFAGSFFRKAAKPLDFNTAALKRLAGVMVLASLTAVALPYVGFIPSCLLSSFAFLLIMGTRVHVAALTALAITAGIYVTFHHGLQVPLPAGRIW